MAHKQWQQTTGEPSLKVNWFTLVVHYFILHTCLNCNVIIFFLWCTAANETVHCVFRHWKLLPILATVISLAFINASKSELYLFRLLYAQAHKMHHLPTIIYLDIHDFTNLVSNTIPKTHFKPPRCRNIIVAALSCNCTEN